MAKYELTNMEIKKISKGQNKDHEYMVATALNTLFIRDTPQTIVEFDERVINAYKPFIPASKGGSGTEEVQLPENLKYTNAHIAEYSPVAEKIPFVKLYVTDGEHYINGKPVSHKQGQTVVNKHGDIALYDKIFVFCEYYMDPEFPGIPQYPRGGTPVEKGIAYFNNFCRSLQELNGTTPEDNSIGSIPSQTTQAPAQPEKQKIGFTMDGKPIYAD